MAPFFRSIVLALTALLLAIAPLATFAQNEEPASTTLYLPLLAQGRAPNLLGAEVSRLSAQRGLDGLLDLRPGWVRRNGLRWRDVEPVQGAGYRWQTAAVQALDEELATAARHGLRVILVLQGSPTWAVDPYGVDCAPINASHYAAFAEFVAAAVRRYSAPPFNVQYWEIGNEPDAFLFEGDSPFGCWGQPDDELYGGRAYGELLKTVYPAVKAANPDAQVIHGGLLLDKPYDPRVVEERTGRFFEGVLAAGAGSSFDLLAFHSYSFYNGTPDGVLGVQDWKPAYLRAIMARYGVAKPLINTEGALLCLDANTTCALAQAHSVARFAVRAMHDELLGFVWYLYDSDSFRSTALVEPAQPTQTRPAYRAYAQTTAALEGQRYIGPIAGLPSGVEGHRLARGQSSTLVVWSNQPQQITLELGPLDELRCVDWDGTALACTATNGALRIEVGPGPRFITSVAPSS